MAMSNAPSSERKVTLLDLIQRVDNAPPDFTAENHHPYYRLYLPLDSRPHGFIHPDTVSRLPWPSSFTVDHDSRFVCINSEPEGTSLADHINAALQQVVDFAVARRDLFPTLSGMHSEPFRLPGANTGSSSGGGRPEDVVHVERFASGLFGIATRGAHLTAYTRPSSSSSSATPLIWVARRSRTLHTYPGMLDSTVAGGVKAHDSPLSCILAECDEEASLPATFVSPLIRAVGVNTLANQNPRTGFFHGEILHLYDLELPEDVHPKPQDDEVEEFLLMDCAEVRTRMEAGEFKPNVCGVMIDFFIRHGIVTPETEGEGDYVEICQRLRRKLPMATRPG